MINMVEKSTSIEYDLPTKFSRKSMMFKKFLLSLLLSAGISGYATAWDYTAMTPDPVPDEVDIAFIGNSITRHAPNKELDWSGDWGMGASKKENDYAHRTATMLGVSQSKIYTRNLYPFETSADSVVGIIDSLETLLSKSKTIVVQLSENVSATGNGGVKQFKKSYSKLISSIPKGKNIFCISSFWKSDETDNVIKSVCNKYGGKYVFIGDIYQNQFAHQNSVLFTNQGVQVHPNDYSMNLIAERLSEKMKANQ
ncbi:hypothetical protein P7U51_004469 [Citrobacter freundii]|uniref:SGNH/GDSL hydrolase family protein n=1 Tax=Citrobacter freundii TaxID=546 RepID=A0AAN4F0U1_CITFR|nr:SGNH/GDSL hydrolase family protein [Citrobacter freundii]